MLLYAPTESIRATLSAKIDIFLGAEKNAPPHSVRRVQLFIPGSDNVFIRIDVPPDALAESGREYQMVPITPGVPARFLLQPHQFLTGSVSEGLAEMGMIVEHLVTLPGDG